MKVGRLDLQLLSIDELWALHEKVGAVLSEKITAEKRALEERLARLNRGLAEKAGIRRAALKTGERRARRRKYPPVLPKYKNPGDPSETWAGRGKQPAQAGGFDLLFAGAFLHQGQTLLRLPQRRRRRVEPGQVLVTLRRRNVVILIQLLRALPICLGFAKLSLRIENGRLGLLDLLWT